MESSDRPVMTVLEGHVAPGQWAKFQQLYDGGSARLPAQMLRTFLVQGADDQTKWRVLSIWRSRAELEEYRRSTVTPGGILMFRAVGAEPTLTIWSVVTALPA